MQDKKKEKMLKKNIREIGKKDCSLDEIRNFNRDVICGISSNIKRQDLKQ